VVRAAQQAAAATTAAAHNVSTTSSNTYFKYEQGAECLCVRRCTVQSMCVTLLIHARGDARVIPLPTNPRCKLCALRVHGSGTSAAWYQTLLRSIMRPQLRLTALLLTCICNRIMRCRSGKRAGGGGGAQGRGGRLCTSTKTGEHPSLSPRLLQR
jgi:hypothetical protein